MISDVLAEAVDEIDRYRRDLPNVYDACGRMLDVVRQIMDATRTVFDASPADSPLLEIARRQIEHDIQTLNMERLNFALRTFHEIVAEVKRRRGVT